MSFVEALPSLPQVDHRNPGIPLDLAWVRDVRVDAAAVERRAHTLPTRRTVKKDWQVAWLLRAITCMDLTTLSGDDTPDRVLRLCTKARQPVRAEILDGLGVSHWNIHVGGVCVYHAMVETAVKALHGSGIPVAAVSAGFPAGMNAFPLRLQEIQSSLAVGAVEIDVVIHRPHVLAGNWAALYEEVAAYRALCGNALLKTILAAGELGTLHNVARTSLVCMMAGADFIKTSTGKESINATLPIGLVMTRAIRTYQERTGFRVGFKPAGGIKTAKQALEWLILVKEELGNEWLSPALFRLGASSLLSDIERQLEYHWSGRYAAWHHQPVA